MSMKVAATYWSQPVTSRSLTSSQKASAILSRGRHRTCRFVHLSGMFGTPSTKLLRSRSSDNTKLRDQMLRRAAYSENVDGYSDEEFVNKIQEYTMKFHNSNANYVNKIRGGDTDSKDKEEQSSNSNPASRLKLDYAEPSWLRIQSKEPLNWPERDDILLASVERKANSVDLPVSLRMIKRKLQWQEGFREAGESAYCSVKKAFSSMVFIIRELHSYTLQMRETLFYEDLQSVMVRVQKEMHASFVWLFQQVFSHTPTFMVYVMILLANFTVYSMASNTAFAAPPPQPAATETLSVSENRNEREPKFDSSAIKTFSVSSSVGKTASVGGNGDGGGKIRPAASGTDGGDGRFDGSSSSNNHRTILPDEISQLSSFGNPATMKETESENRGIMNEEVMKLWNSVVEEASKMKAVLRSESLDHETMRRFVSPVKAEMEPEDYSDYFRTELLYQQALSQEPNNPLLLANYAQFLYLVVHDHDRAEEYFKRAIGVEPPDAESLGRYASFLWRVRKDQIAAEEIYLEAIATEPGNTYHAANYANFLWNTGGQDTCYPLNNDYSGGA